MKRIWLWTVRDEHLKVGPASSPGMLGLPWEPFTSAHALWAFLGFRQTRPGVLRPPVILLPWTRSQGPERGVIVPVIPEEGAIATLGGRERVVIRCRALREFRGGLLTPSVVASLMKANGYQAVSLDETTAEQLRRAVIDGRLRELREESL